MTRSETPPYFGWEGLGVVLITGGTVVSVDRVKIYHDEGCCVEPLAAAGSVQPTTYEMSRRVNVDGARERGRFHFLSHIFGGDYLRGSARTGTGRKR